MTSLAAVPNDPRGSPGKPADRLFSGLWSAGVKISMERQQMTLYFEDFTAGHIFDLGQTRVDEQEMLQFARRFDPQPFHVDPAAAADTAFGGIIASGWFTAALFMRLYVDAVLADSTSQGSPGGDELRWLSPVRAGDMLSGRLTVVETRPSARRADRGSAVLRGELYRDGEAVFRTTFRGLFGRRTPADS